MWVIDVTYIATNKGIQYVPEKLEEVLDKSKVTINMSSKGNYWYYAVSKSSFKTLKQDLI